MRVLAELARHPGEDVTRESLMKAVWDGGSVSGSALTNAIWELRQALGDNRSEPAFIQTVPGKGYRLVASATPARDRRVPSPRKVTLLYALGLLLAFLLGLGVGAL